MVETLVLLAVTAALGTLGVWIARQYWGLWRRGVETRATIIEARSAGLGTIRFLDQQGREVVVRNTTPPRYGRFVLNGTRLLTYLPENPQRWEWWDRKYQRFMVFLGGWICAIALGLAAAALSPLLRSRHDGLPRSPATLPPQFRIPESPEPPPPPPR
jgi:hypothetical protein